MSSAGTGSRTTPFGAQLRLLREARGLSQLALAIQAGTPSRHVSFLETGRSRPSAEMVVRLGEALDASLRQQNELLMAAGLAPRYPEEKFEGISLEPYPAALSRLLAAHEPYPALVVDRLWNVVAANAASNVLFGEVVGENIVRRYLEDHDAVENWPEVAAAARSRLRPQLRQTPGDDALRALVELVERETAEFPETAAPDVELVVCPRFRIGDELIRTAVLAARFDHPLEVTLAELRVELVYPLDETSAAFFRAATAR